MQRIFQIGILATCCVASAASGDIVDYSNITNFTGNGYAHGGSATTAGNTITTMVADKIQGLSGGVTVNSFTFSVANFNATAVSARPRVRFFADNAGGSAPGTLLAAFSFTPISFSAGSVQLFSANVAGAFTVGQSGAFWAGMFFDNNTGGTGATLAQMNNLGQGIFNPPTVGSSADSFFQTTTGGVVPGSNPAGGLFSFGGVPVANFGWAFSVTAIPEPGSMALMGLAGLGGLYRLRRRTKLVAA